MSNQHIAASLAVWHECVAAGDMNRLDEILADDVRFHSPVVWKPKDGKPIVKAILSTASAVFENFAYHREMTDGTTWTLEFSATIGDRSLKGVDIIRFNEDGKIVEFEVMVRPGTGLEALGNEMGRRLAALFGKA